MKTATANELQAFHRFVGEKLGSTPADLSPEEVLGEWRILHPCPDELSASVAAVRNALDDMAAGDPGRPVAEVIAGLRKRHNLSSD
jgi:hypothetical protein